MSKKREKSIFTADQSVIKLLSQPEFQPLASFWTKTLEREAPKQDSELLRQQESEGEGAEGSEWGLEN